MKFIHAIMLFIGITAAMAGTEATYNVTPVQSKTVSVQSAVWEKAKELVAEYGTRPPYPGPRIIPGAPQSAMTAQAVAPYVLACESGARDVGCHIDSNGLLSCGPAQFQKWKTHWEPVLHVYGSPTNTTTAVTALVKAIQMGFIGQWSCAKIEKIVK